MTGFLTFYFKGSDELEAEDRIQSILWEDKYGTRSVATMRFRHYTRAVRAALDFLYLFVIILRYAFHGPGNAWRL